MIIESMKMEIPVTAKGAGTVISVLVAEGASVSDGDTVMVLDLA
jgi:biotin carboxyl carrier protein